MVGNGVNIVMQKAHRSLYMCFDSIHLLYLYRSTQMQFSSNALLIASVGQRDRCFISERWSVEQHRKETLCEKVNLAVSKTKQGRQRLRC